LQSGPIHGRAGEPAVVITCTQAKSSPRDAGWREGFAGFALRLRDIGEQPLQSGPICGRAGESPSS
jgi:hypothetical protein